MTDDPARPASQLSGDPILIVDDEKNIRRTLRMVRSRAPSTGSTCSPFEVESAMILEVIAMNSPETAGGTFASDRRHDRS